MNSASDCPYEDRLHTLEQRLAEPLVPGELQAWLQEVVDPFNALVTSYRQAKDDRHRQLDEIAEQDDGLLPRVQSMRDDEQSLNARIDALESQLQTLQAALNDDQQQAAAEQDVKIFREDGQKITREIRELEEAIATWFVESFQRDRGNVD